MNEGKKRVLVVDDEPDFVAVVKTYLEKAGFQVDVAYDGVQGLDKVRTQRPGVIVLDVMMPEKDGYTVCRELKQDSAYKDIPIVLLTAVGSKVSSTTYSHFDGMSMEADDYLPKPASAEEITESVKRLLGL